MDKSNINKNLYKIIICICISFAFIACETIERKRRPLEKEQNKCTEEKIGRKNIADELFIITPDPLEKREIEINEKILLPVVPSIQKNNYYCGPASVQMVLRLFHIEYTQDQLSDLLQTSSNTGTEYESVANVLNKSIFHKSPIHVNDAGYRVQTLSVNDHSEESKGFFYKRLKRDIQDGYPVLLAVNLPTLYPGMPVANHMIVCIGYQLKQNSEEVEFYYIIDPYTEVQDAQYGGLKIFTPEELYQAIVHNVEPAYIW